MKRLACMGLCWIGLSVIAACDKTPDSAQPKGEDLTIVVEADRSKISEEEERLKARQAAFEDERRRLREEKERLMDEKAQVQDKDKSAAKRLKELEQRLWEKERSMWSKESQIESERQKLALNKSELLEKVVSSPGAVASGGTVAAREGAVALREKSFAQRENDLARREKDLALREKDLAQREAEFLQLQARLASVRVPAVARSAPAGTRVTQKQAEQSFKAVAAKMQQRGILWGDLPPELAGLRSEYYEAKKEGDFSRARESVAQLDAALSAVVVDAGFIDRKFARLNELIKQKPPKDKQAVSTLLRKATQMVGDGKYQAANRELNRIFALLTR
jgi:DNA repair exonuclease SbcCD ATPase subunit